VGYRLEDSTIVFNGVEPIHFFVERVPEEGDSWTEPQATALKWVPPGVFEEEYLARFGSDIQTFEKSQPNHMMLTYTQSEGLKLSVKIRVVSEHVGEPADLLVVARHRDKERGLDSMRVWDNWEVWDSVVENLKPTQSYSALPETLDITVYEGDLVNIAAEFVFESNGHLLTLTDTAGEYIFLCGLSFRRWYDCF
jgi:hypothetical protein